MTKYSSGKSLKGIGRSLSLSTRYHLLFS